MRYSVLLTVAPVLVLLTSDSCGMGKSRVARRAGLREETVIQQAHSAASLERSEVVIPAAEACFSVARLDLRRLGELGRALSLGVDLALLGTAEGFQVDRLEVMRRNCS